MTERREEAKESAPDRDSGKPVDGVSSSRRALLRGAAIAAPTIVSMGSASAALAASSFQTYTGVASPQADGRYYCVDQNTTLGPSVKNIPNSLDVGSSPVPVLQRYPERDYKIAKNNSPASSVSEVTMCQNSAVGPTGTTYYYQENGSWKGVQIKRGILASANAMSSINGYTVDAPTRNV